MKKDEYNVVKITNEDENLSFEFGLTQKNESTSYPDNEDKRRDDLNDACICWCVDSYHRSWFTGFSSRYSRWYLHCL